MVNDAKELCFFALEFDAGQPFLVAFTELLKPTIVSTLNVSGI